jgi:hypothetical protein
LDETRSFLLCRHQTQPLHSMHGGREWKEKKIGHSPLCRAFSTRRHNEHSNYTLGTKPILFKKEFHLFTVNYYMYDWWPHFRTFYFQTSPRFFFFFFCFEKSWLIFSKQWFFFVETQLHTNFEKIK